MKWTRTDAKCRSRLAWVALCAHVFCMVFIYLAHGVLNGGGHAGGFSVSFDEQPCPSDMRPPVVLHPHLYLLAHASHILC